MPPPRTAKSYLSLLHGCRDGLTQCRSFFHHPFKLERNKCLQSAQSAEGQFSILCKVRYLRISTVRPRRSERQLTPPTYLMLPVQSHRNLFKLRLPFHPTFAAFVRWNFLFPPTNRGEISLPEYCKFWGSYAPPAHRIRRNDAIASSSRCSTATAVRKSPSAASAFSKVIHSVSGTSGADHLSRR